MVISFEQHSARLTVYYRTGAMYPSFSPVVI
jgi:hypothetical protein